MMAKGHHIRNKEQEFPLLETNQEQGEYYEEELAQSTSPPRKNGYEFLFRSPWKYAFIFLAFLVPAFFLYHVLGSFLKPSKPVSDLPTALRPSFHFATPPETWLNDPNGLFIDSKGLWHMYYQHLPTYESGGCKNWAHATSKDLYSWELHPLALICEDYGMWSGSIVVDTNNTSGLFPKGHVDGVVAIYTQHKLDTNTEEQSIAYSLDGGYTFNLYKKNPVLRLEPESYNFRDPKVVWHPESNKWVMAVAYAHSQQIAFYNSHNLLDWTFTSAFTNPVLSEQRPTFECPNLVRIPYITAQQVNISTTNMTPADSQISWVLLVSNGGGSPYNGGSLTRYFPGDFNGTHFNAIDERADRIIDFGTDNYAAQYFYGTSESTLPIAISWAGNIATCGELPSGPREHWRGMMSLPRSTALLKTDTDVVYVQHASSIDNFRGKTLTDIKTSDALDLSVNLAEVKSGAVILDARITKNVAKSPISAILGTKLHFLFSSSISGEEVDCFLQFSMKGPGFGCDRSKAAGWETNDNFKTMIIDTIPRLNENEQAWDIQIIFDTSVLEVYLGKGLQVGTMAFFPENKLDTFVMKSEGLTGEVEVIAKLQELNRP